MKYSLGPISQCFWWRPWNRGRDWQKNMRASAKNVCQVWVPLTWQINAHFICVDWRTQAECFHVYIYFRKIEDRKDCSPEVWKLGLMSKLLRQLLLASSRVSGGIKIQLKFSSIDSPKPVLTFHQFYSFYEELFFVKGNVFKIRFRNLPLVRECQHLIRPFQQLSFGKNLFQHPWSRNPG